MIKILKEKMTSNTFNDSDFESLSETSSEDQDIFSIYGGQAQSILSNLEDSIGKIDDFLSFEREYSHGNIVRAVEDPSGQMGQVVQVNMFVDLENVFGRVFRDVSSSKLLRLRSFSVGDYVVHGPWLGRVDKIVDCIGVLFDDGTKCEVMATDPEKLVAVSPNLLDDSLYPYHPGQRVRVELSSISKSSGWLCGMSKKNQDEGMVCSVKAGIVFVDWLASALVTLTTTVPSPSCTPDPKDLAVLSCFLHTSWQLGEWCILPVSEKSLEANNACEGNLLKEKQKLESESTRRDFASKLEEMVVIMKKRIKVDVMWQDGTLSRGLDSGSLFPVSAVNAHNFFPEQLVLEKESCDVSNIVVNQRWGVVKTVDADEHTLKVEWRTMDEDARDYGNLGEETVSAYELIEHPDFSYSFGDIVFLLEKHNFVGQTDGLTMGHVALLKANHGGYDSDQDHETCFLSSIGNVIGFKDGNVQVQWASGIITEVMPYKLVRVDKDDGSTATHVLHEEDDVEANHELVERETESFHKEKDLFDINHVDEDYPKHNGNSSFFGLPQAAIGFFSKFATNIFRSPGSTSMGQQISHSPITNEDEARNIHGPEALESSNIYLEVLAEAITGLDEPKDASLRLKVEEMSENREITSMSCEKNSERFKQFDIVKDCSDHHFINGVGKGSALSQVKRGWLKKVQQEWSLLQQDLPETIYVRIYEERMDLIRAAIIGVAGTPYHDGLFFFDIFLPPDYPNEAPMVHYHSGGLRLNPNLYESGRVCLSLLNTWTGTGSEVWNPETSTILQVLLSLQALVLNDKPYFNEAGYDKQIGRMDGEKNSVSYNENAFLITCKSILYLLRKPPKNFEDLVEEHFKGRSQQILLACKAYMEGTTPVGMFGHEMKNEGERYRGNSTGFKIMLTKLFPKLAEAFSGGGADCNEGIEPGK